MISPLPSTFYCGLRSHDLRLVHFSHPWTSHTRHCISKSWSFDSQMAGQGPWAYWSIFSLCKPHLSDDIKCVSSSLSWRNRLRNTCLLQLLKGWKLYQLCSSRTACEMIVTFFGYKLLSKSVYGHNGSEEDKIFD